MYLISRKLQKMNFLVGVLITCCRRFKPGVSNSRTQKSHYVIGRGKVGQKKRGEGVICISYNFNRLLFIYFHQKWIAAISVGQRRCWLYPLTRDKTTKKWFHGYVNFIQWWGLCSWDLRSLWFGLVWFGFFVLWHINLPVLFNVKAIRGEQSWYYFDISRIRGFIPLPRVFQKGS